MESQQKWMYRNIPLTRDEWSAARRVQGLDDVNICRTVGRLAAMNHLPSSEPQTLAFTNFQTYITIACCHVLYQTQNGNAAATLMSSLYPGSTERTLNRYRQLAMKLIRWMVCYCCQPYGYHVFEGMFHAAISVPSLSKVKEPVLNEIFGGTIQRDISSQTPTVIPLYIPFLVHRRLHPLSFKATCETLGIHHCQTEYGNWLQWLAGGSPVTAPVQTHPHELQQYGGTGMSNEAPMQTPSESTETPEGQNITEAKLPSKIIEISLDFRDERRRSQPKEFDGYPGNFVGLELYTVELLCTLESYIAIPLSNSSLTMSYLAYPHAMQDYITEPEGQHKWLECYEKLANQVCEDLINCKAIRSADICRLPVALYRKANVEIGTVTPDGWIQVLVHIAWERGSCEVTLRRHDDNGSKSVLGRVLWNTDEMLVLDERVSFIPTATIHYIAMVIPKP